MKAPLDLSNLRSAATRLLGTLFLTTLLAGCNLHLKPVEKLQYYGSRYKPSNVYSKDKILSSSIRRVALLPITGGAATEAFQDGIEGYQPLLQAELNKTMRFDIVKVTPQQLNELTGRSRWSADEQLPSDFLEKVRVAAGCDAVFFAQLTRYQPYEPMAVGWKLSLVSAQDKQIYWAADETFDAGDGRVANAARDYQVDFVRYEGPLADPDAILSSPSRFGQYTLHALLATLPPRQDTEAAK